MPNIITVCGDFRSEDLPSNIDPLSCGECGALIGWIDADLTEQDDNEGIFCHLCAKEIAEANAFRVGRIAKQQNEDDDEEDDDDDS